MQINVLGYGLMAKQIAALLSLGGYKVYVWNHKKIDLSEIDRQMRVLRKLTGLEKKGEIVFVEKIEDLEDYLTIESVIEDINVKKDIYKILSGKITNAYCTNTSSVAPGEIGSEVHGLHFFNPITIKFVEYFEATTPSNDLLELLKFLELSDFEVLPVHDHRGYLGNNILFNEISTAFKLVEKYNYSVMSVSKFYDKFYNGRDLFNIVDLIGIDVVRSILRNLKDVDDTIYIPECLSVAISNGVLGKKNKTSIKQVL